jgi:hypothetical protein
MRHLSQSANAVAGPTAFAFKNECLGLGSWIAPDEGPGSAPSRKPKKRRPLVPGAALRAHGFQLALDEVLTLRGRVAAKDHIGAAIDKDGLAGHLAVRLTSGLQGAEVRQTLASQGCCSRGTPSGRG